MKIYLIAAAATLAHTQVFAMDSLSQFEWKNRVLLLFGNSGDALLERQRDILETQSAELADRDMVVLHVSGDGVRAIYGDAPSIDGARLRAEADVFDDGFRTILVGKDGGVKLRSEKVVSSLEIFGLIDRMPMRRAGQS